MSLYDEFKAAARRLLSLGSPATMNAMTFVSVSKKQPGTPDPTEGETLYSNPTGLVPYDASRINTYDTAQARKVSEGQYTVYTVQTVVTPIGDVGYKRANTTEKALTETPVTQEAAAALLKGFELELSKKPGYQVLESAGSTKRHYAKFAPKA